MKLLSPWVALCVVALMFMWIQHNYASAMEGRSEGLFCGWTETIIVKCYGDGFQKETNLITGTLITKYSVKR